MGFDGDGSLEDGTLRSVILLCREALDTLIHYNFSVREDRLELSSVKVLKLATDNIYDALSDFELDRYFAPKNL